MKLAISNLAWPAEQEKTILALMKQYGYTGLEIAPGKVIPVDPYGNINEAKKWANMMGRDRQLSIISLQSIWYGRQEMLFGDLAERNFLLNYTMKAIDFANAVGAKNLVFGCPKNRNIPKNADLNNAHSLAVDFFRQLGDYALDREVVIGMEANPAIYGTNFLNTTKKRNEVEAKQLTENMLRLQRLKYQINAGMFNDDPNKRALADNSFGILVKDIARITGKDIEVVANELNNYINE